MEGLSDRLDKLSPAKRALLEQLLRKTGTGTKTREEIPRRPPHEPPVLSYAQERMWFLEQWDAGNAFYHLAEGLWLRGRLDRAALRGAIVRIGRRHGALRTRIETTPEGPRPVIETALDPEWQEQDFADEARAEEAARQWISERAAEPFDLASGPLWRLSLARIGEESHLLSVTLHHSAADGWSLGILLRELTALYGASVRGETVRGETPQLPEPSIDYADFAAWQKQWLASEQLQRQTDAWLQRLRGLDPLFELPVARVRPARMSHRGEHVAIPLDEESGSAVRGLANRCGATPFMVLIAAWALVLSRWSRRSDLVIGTPVANRNRANTEDVVGCFVNMLPLRFDLSETRDFEACIAHVKRVSLDAFAAQDTPFETLVDALQLERNPSHSPLFQVIFALQNAPVGSASVPGLDIEPVRFDLGRSGFDLSLIFEPDASGYDGELRYNPAIYRRRDMERLAESYRMLLRTALADPTRDIDRLPLLSREALDEQLEARRPAIDRPLPHRALHHRFERRAAESPGRTALIFAQGSPADGASLSYGELDRRANRLAHRLIRRGVRPGDLVGLCLRRSLDLVASILAILKAGAAYVPLDPINPAARLRLIVDDARPILLVTESSLAGLLAEAEIPELVIDSEPEEAGQEIGQDEAADEATQSPGIEVAPEGPAYVIYTSGSTGRPKGVLISHRNAARLFTVTEDDYDFGPDDVWTLFHSYAFDFSVWEMWGALAYGGSLVVVRHDVARSGERFHDLLAEQRVTVLNQTPSAFRQLMEVDAERGRTLALRWVIFGGEALDPSALAPWIDRHGDESPRLVNMYGITETTVHVTFRRLTADDARSRHSRIGVPLGDLAAYVLDPRLEPVPDGVPGEIHVAGAGLASGYLARPELTAQRFVTAPFEVPGGRLYRTGDLARWVDGKLGPELEYLGRIDHQVKLRGYRIELGEIDSALQALPSVGSAVTRLYGDDPSRRRLVAWVVPAPGREVDPDALTAGLQRRLPEYMIPTAFVALDSLPLTPNGKLDPKALPAPGHGRDAGESRYLTETEDALAAIWRDLLDVEEVAADDDFFSLGGHSLIATRLVSRVRAEMGGELSVRGVFESPTLETMAASLDSALDSASAPAPAPTSDPRPGSDVDGDRDQDRDRDEPVLSFGQERLWFLDRLASEATRTAYVVPAALRLEGGLDVERLRRAFTEIVRRHEPLRTAVVGVEGRPVPQLLPAVDVELPRVDLSDLDAAQRETARQRAFERLLREPFDLAAGPLLRLELLRFSEHDHALHVALHHIAADGWSVAVLMRELSHFYRLGEGEASELPEPKVTYADHAECQRRRMERGVKERLLDFWRRRLASLPPTLEPASDRSRPPQRSLEAGRADFAVPPELMARLRALGQRIGATPFMTLMTTFSVLLSRESGQRDLTLGTPVAGRTSAELENLVGFFVNTLVLRFDLEANPSFETHLRRTRDSVLDAFEHQDLPFELIVDDLKPPRNLAHSPLFQVMLAYQEANDRLLDLPGVTWTSLPVPVPQTKFDLSFSLAETEAGGLEGELIYARDLWEPPSIDAMLRRFSMLLESAADDPQRGVDDLPWMNAEQRESVLALASNPRPYDLGQPLVRRLEALAEQHADATAMVAGEERWTFAELHARADRLAAQLMDRGLGTGSIVGLHLDACPQLLVALLAVMKAGAAYLPLDPSYPERRLQHMVRVAEVPLILTRSSVHRPIRLGDDAVDMLDLDAVNLDAVNLDRQDLDPTVQAARPAMVVEPVIGPSDPAYVLFTSGSTGLPKGVLITQRSLANYTAWIEDVFLEEAGLRSIPWVTTLAFDTSLKQVFGPWLVGRPVRIVPRDEVTRPQKLADALDAPDSALSCVPTLWELLLEHLESGDVAPPAGLRALLLGGEAVSPSLVERSLRAIPGLRIWNFYGPTETTATSINGELRAGEPVTLGRPVANNLIYVLDEEGRPVPPLVAGEIHIGGVGVSPGYVNQPETTAERFRPNPFGPGRVYRTGDAARFLRDGRVEFLGRVDRQVKVRGMRIEPAEIEAVLTDHPSVLKARVSLDAQSRLVAHVVPEIDRDQLAEVREFLKARLPEHMVPSGWCSLAVWPRLPNGKIDEASLPAPEPLTADGSGAGAPPQSETERRVAALWSEVLGSDDEQQPDSLDVHASFFDLGGHSLLVVRLHSRLRREWPDLELQVIDIFRFPTIYGQACRLDDQLARSDFSTTDSPTSDPSTSDPSAFDPTAPPTASAAGVARARKRKQRAAARAGRRRARTRNTEE